MLPQARARSSSGGSKKPAGKLGVQLAAQKKQTRAETLREASAVERLQREADANAGALRND